MQITETSVDGLKREFKVVLSAKDIDEKVQLRLTELSRTVRMPGFRPGKVPMPIVKQRYGGSVRGEILEKAVTDSSQQAMSERGLRVALQPKIELTQYQEGSDLEYTMAVELLPDIEPMDFATLELERPVVQVDDQVVEEALIRVAKSRQQTEPVTEDRSVAKGETVVIDFDGTVEGKALPGMKGAAYPLELGSGTFVDTFEDQIVGAKAGEHRQITVTFPADYGNQELAGKQAVFEVDVKELRAPVETAIDDALARQVGLDDVQALRDVVRERVSREYADLSRARVKRVLLDKLAEAHEFAVPPGMVEIEFEAIWRRLQEEMSRGGMAVTESGRSEDDIKAEYRGIAERRVRLGLLLSEVGRRNNIEVQQDELNKVIIAEMRRYPGREREVLDFYRNSPEALHSLRAPLYEEKVVDFILELAKVTEKPVSIEELVRDPDETPTSVASGATTPMVE